MLKNILLKCLVITGFCLQAQSFQVTYGFPNVDPTTGSADPGPFPSANGIQLGAFTANGVSSSPSASGRFSFTGWPTGALNGDDNFANFTGNFSPLSFYRFTIRVVNGYTLTLNTIEFSVRRSGTGPRNYSVKCSEDNFTTNLSVSTGTNTRLSVIPTDVFLWKYDSISTSNDQFGSAIHAGASMQHLTDSVTFHFYAWNAESNGGSFSIDNVKISGFVKSAADTNAVGMQHISGNEEELTVYPNPVEERFFLIRGKNISDIHLSDLSGKRIFISYLPTGDGMIRVDVGALDGGVYLLTIETEAGTIRRKVLLGSQR